MSRFARTWGGNDLRFGIEAWYVQEGTGKQIERLRNAGQLSAETAMTPWGQVLPLTVRLAFRQRCDLGGE